MEITYIPPASWTDKGMDWKNPNPFCLDYWYAIAAAMLERHTCYTVYGGNALTSVLNAVKPFSIPKISTLDSMNESIGNMMNLFVIPEKKGTGSFSRIPDITGISKIPARGKMISDCGPWMMEVKNVLDAMRYAPIKNVSGYECKTYRIYSGKDYPTIGEAIGAAMDRIEEYTVLSSYTVASCNVNDPYSTKKNYFASMWFQKEFTFRSYSALAADVIDYIKPLTPFYSLGLNLKEGLNKIGEIGPYERKNIEISGSPSFPSVNEPIEYSYTHDFYLDFNKSFRFRA